MKSKDNSDHKRFSELRKIRKIFIKKPTLLNAIFTETMLKYTQWWVEK